MAGLDQDMLTLIEFLAKNKIQDAKNAAIQCCENDTTKKNQIQIGYYKRLLESGNTNFMELPVILQSLMRMEDVSSFREDRYYLGKTQKKLFDQICRGRKVTDKLMEYGIPYRNTSIMYGKPGTGKTEFARYVAYKLGLPYAYLNFSHLIDSLMGKTAQNIQRVFDFCKGQQCVLMLDEIDCIGITRKKGSGSDAEMGRITITLMQCLDDLVDGQIVLAATNRKDILDDALDRRFRNKVEFKVFDQEEELNMIQKFVDSIDVMEMDQDLVEYAKKRHTQSETIDHLVEKLIQIVSKE